MISVLERERRRQGLTATDLAARMGVSASTLSQVERGRLLPTTEFKERTASALGVALDQLFPTYFVLVAEDRGLRLAGSDGRAFVFNSKSAAKRAAKVLSARVEGPVPIGYIATLLGISEVEAVERVRLEPAAGELAACGGEHP